MPSKIHSIAILLLFAPLLVEPASAVEPSAILSEQRQSFNQALADYLQRREAFQLIDETRFLDEYCHERPNEGEGTPPPESRQRTYSAWLTEMMNTGNAFKERLDSTAEQLTRELNKSYEPENVDACNEAFVTASRKMSAQGRAILTHRNALSIHLEKLNRDLRESTHAKIREARERVVPHKAQICVRHSEQRALSHRAATSMRDKMRVIDEYLKSRANSLLAHARELEESREECNSTGAGKRRQ